MYTNTTITKMNLNISEAFQILNVCISRLCEYIVIR